MKRVLVLFLLLLAMGHSGKMSAQGLDWGALFGMDEEMVNLQTAFSYYNLAMMNQEQGDYSSAMDFIKQAWDLIKDYDDAESAYIRIIISSALGSFYNTFCDYDNAEKYALSSIELAKNTYGGSLPNEAATLVNNLGLVYYNLGDYDNALTYYIQACEMYESFMAEDTDYDPWQSMMKDQMKDQMSKTYALYLANVGGAYFKKGEWDLAAKYFGEAKTQLEQLYAKQPDINTADIYAAALNNYGMIWHEKGDDKKAEQICTQALDIFKRAHPTGHIYLAGAYKNLGIIAYSQKEYPKSLSYYQQARNLIEAELDVQHPDHISILNHIGEWYYNQKQYSQAAPFVEKTMTLTKDRYIQTINYLPERQRALYWDVANKEIQGLHQNFAYRIYPKNKSFSGFAYNNELFVKGFLLTSSSIVRQSIQESNNEELIQKWDDLIHLKEFINALKSQSSQSSRIAEYEQKAEQLEKEITRSSAAYRENMRQWNITWDSVRAVLKPKQVAIEFMRAPLNEDSTMYCALLLRHDSDYPELIPLFEEKQVTKLLHTSTGDPAKINKTYLFGLNGDTLTRLIWGNILPYIHKGEEIYISPTHLLHQIAIEHLPYDETHTMNEVYSIVRLSSTRELVLPENPIPHKKATLYGGIDYKEQTDATMAFNMKRFARRDMSASQRGTQRQLHDKAVDPLDGTQAEVDTIESILKGQRITVKVYSDYSACEESVKGLSGKKQNILHFATHGMYVDTLTTNDPLDRCLLVFAGANRALTGGKLREDVDDGLLSAKEISVLDFREADIVVMSACETGLGDVSGEGVFGLQRAFKMAGAQTILMALWQVDDNATQMLMTAFYRYYSKGISKREAFRKAQQEVRNYTETKTVPHYTDEMSQEERMANQGKIVAPKTVTETITEKPYEAPYFWAGFILLD